MTRSLVITLLVAACALAYARAQTATYCPGSTCSGDVFVCNYVDNCLYATFICASSPCNATCEAVRACSYVTLYGRGDTTIDCNGEDACTTSVFFGNGTSVVNCGNFDSCSSGECSQSCDGSKFNAASSESLVVTLANAALHNGFTVTCPTNGTCSVPCLDSCVCTSAYGGCPTESSYLLTINIGNGPIQHYWDSTPGPPPLVPNYQCNAALGQWMCPNLENQCVDPIGPIGTYSGECSLNKLAAWTTAGTASLTGQVAVAYDVSNTKDCMIVPPAGPVVTGFTIISTRNATMCCPHTGMVDADGKCTIIPCNSGSPISTSDFASRSVLASSPAQTGDACILIDSACYDVSQNVAISVFMGNQFTGTATYASVSKRTAASAASAAAPLRDASVRTAAYGYQAAFSVSTSAGDFGCVAQGTVIEGTGCEIPWGCATTTVSDYIYNAGGSDCYALCYAP